MRYGAYRIDGAVAGAFSRYRFPSCDGGSASRIGVERDAFRAGQDGIAAAGCDGAAATGLKGDGPSLVVYEQRGKRILQDET